MLIQEEVWKDIKGYEGYYRVSNMGRIKSVKRTILKRNGVQVNIPEKLLKPVTNSCGLGIVLSKDGRMTILSYHKLLKTYFKEGFKILNNVEVFHKPEGEVFVPVRGYEGLYEISNKGTILSLSRRVILRGSIDRIVSYKILQHNFVHVCLCKTRGITTTTFSRILVSSFFKEFDPEIHYIRKVGNTGDLLKDYQFFLRRERNGMTVTQTDGTSLRFENYIECAKHFNYPRKEVLLDIVFKGQSPRRKNMQGLTFVFDAPYCYKGKTLSTSTIVCKLKQLIL